MEKWFSHPPRQTLLYWLIYLFIKSFYLSYQRGTDNLFIAKCSQTAHNLCIFSHMKCERNYFHWDNSFRCILKQDTVTLFVRTNCVWKNFDQKCLSGEILFWQRIFFSINVGLECNKEKCDRDKIGAGATSPRQNSPLCD